jgi:hypothetical protein
VKVHWCAHCGKGSNFGDILGPLLLRRYGVEVEWAPGPEAELISCGSILAKVPDGWTGIVLGSGFIRAGTTRDLSRATVLAVRGEMTRDACSLTASTPLGDPGILVDELIDERPTKSRRALLVPHHVDRRMRWRHLRTPVSSVTGDPRQLLLDIASAEVVYTSSLHGLIAADVFGVPHILEPYEKVRGGLFKFEDYVSAFGDTIRPGVERLTDRAAMQRRQDQIRAAFRSLTPPPVGSRTEAGIANGLD